MRGDDAMLLGLLIVAGGIILTKYGVTAIIVGIGVILIALGLKSKSS